MSLAKIASPWTLYNGDKDCWVRWAFPIDVTVYYGVVQRVGDRWENTRAARFTSLKAAMEDEDIRLQQRGIVFVTQEKWDRLLVLK